MNILYGARVARFDLLRQASCLARNIPRWTSDDDKKAPPLDMLHSPHQALENDRLGR